MNTTPDEIRSMLIRQHVPMVRKTFPEVRWLSVSVTKRDRFFRANGKIISKNLAVAALRCGVAEVSA